MKHILWLLVFIPSMLVAQAPPKADTVVTIIKRAPSVVSCTVCSKKDSSDHAKLYALLEELKRQKQVPAQNSGNSTLTKVSAATSFLALAGVVYLIFKKNSSSHKDTYGDEEMKLKP